MDVVTLGAALSGSKEQTKSYVKSHFKGGSNIQIVDNPDGTQTINASGEVSSEDTVARAEIAAIKDGETLDSFGDVETALDDKADSTTTYTKTEVDTALGNKADKSTTYTKTEVDTALGNKVDKVSGKGLSTNDYTNDEKTKLSGIAEGAEVNEIVGIKVNNTTINPDANKVVNITVPTTAADVSALPDTTKYAAALSLTINSSTYVMTGQLKDQNGDNLGTAQTIDLPLESVVVNGSYDSQTKKVVLTLQNGNTIEFSVADLVSGLQTELSASNKLNPAYINYDSTHRAVSDTEKSTWNSKQNAIDSSHKLSAGLVDDTSTTNKFATVAELEQIQTNKNNILLTADQSTKYNILPVTLNSGTISNVTFTVNADKSISTSGTANSNITNAYINKSFTLPTSGEYVLCGCASGGSSANTGSYRIDMLDGGISGTQVVADTGSGVVFTPSQFQNTTACVRLRIGNGANMNGKTFKPMIIPKAIYDAGFTDYQPYAMSNAEITAWILAHS